MAEGVAEVLRWLTERRLDAATLLAPLVQAGFRSAAALDDADASSLASLPPALRRKVLQASRGKSRKRSRSSAAVVRDEDPKQLKARRAASEVGLQGAQSGAGSGVTELQNGLHRARDDAAETLREVPKDKDSERRLLVNRSPAMILWGATVAELLGLDWSSALSMASAMASLNARSHGTALGIFSSEGAASKAQDAYSAPLSPGEACFALLGREIRARKYSLQRAEHDEIIKVSGEMDVNNDQDSSDFLNAAVRKESPNETNKVDGTGEKYGDRIVSGGRLKFALRGLQHDFREANPRTVLAGLRRSFGGDLERVYGTMKAVISQFDAEKLRENGNRAAYDMYATFRPTVASGRAGWGAKGPLLLDRIEAIASDYHFQSLRQEPAKEEPLMQSLPVTSSVAATTTTTTTTTTTGAVPMGVPQESNCEIKQEIANEHAQEILAAISKAGKRGIAPTRLSAPTQTLDALLLDGLIYQRNGRFYAS